MIRFRDILPEYSDTQKQQMGIPKDAISKGGKWYVGDKYVGRVVQGKFVAVKSVNSTDSGQSSKVMSSVKTRPTVDLSGKVGFDLKRIRIDIEHELKFDESEPTEEDIDEAQKHGFTILFDAAAHTAVDFWKQFSIWRTSENRRNEIFNAIDRFIDTTKAKVTTKKPLYRGAHFSTAASGLARTLLNECRLGSTIKLPPAGFSINAQYAYGFAEVPTPVLSVLFILRPKETGLEGVHIWDVDPLSDDLPKHEGELEIITRSSTYTVTNITMQKFKNVSVEDSDGNVEVKDSMFLMIELEQSSSVNELIIKKTSSNSQKTLDFLFGDSMKHTAKNLRRMRK